MHRSLPSSSSSSIAINLKWPQTFTFADHDEGDNRFPSCNRCLRSARYELGCQWQLGKVLDHFWLLKHSWGVCLQKYYDDKTRVCTIPRGCSRALRIHEGSYWILQFWPTVRIVQNKAERLVRKAASEGAQIILLSVRSGSWMYNPLNKLNSTKASVGKYTITAWAIILNMLWK